MALCFASPILGINLITTRSSTLPLAECKSADIIVPTAYQPVTPGECGSRVPRKFHFPFYVQTSPRDTALVIFLDRAVVDAPLTSLPVPSRSVAWRILVTNHALNSTDLEIVKKKLAVDAVVGGGDCPTDSCHYSIEKRSLVTRSIESGVVTRTPIERPVILGVAGCSAISTVGIDLSVPTLSASVQIANSIGISFCVVKIDSRIAHLDHQLEWMQANLIERPCRESDWVIISVAHGDLDYETVDYIDNTAAVDIVFSDRVVPDLTTPQLVAAKGTESFTIAFREREAHSFPSCTTSGPSPVALQARADERLSTSPRRTISRVPVGVIVTGILLAGLAGLSINVSLRRSASLRKSDQPVE